MKNVTRREFMFSSAKLAGMAAGAIALGSGMPFPTPGATAEIEFPESSCGTGPKAGPKILVAYASRCGSTGGVAEAIGQVLCECGATVDIRLVESVTDMAPYKSVVVGSAVRSDTWLPEATEFVEKNRQKLARIPVAYFLTCLTVCKPTEKNRSKALTFLNPLRQAVPEVQPVDTGLFAGVLDYSKLSWIVRTVMKSKMKSKGVSEGDYRDWSVIHVWAKDLCPRLLPNVQSG